MPPIRNPFKVFGPIPPERFIGRERDVNTILTRLTDTRPGSSAIHGERWIGKTSLLHYLKSKKIRQDWGISSDDFTFIYFDCGVIDDPIDKNFWKTVFAELKSEVSNQALKTLLEATSNNKLTTRLQKLFRAVSELNHRLVILLDEFEIVIKKDVTLLKRLRAFVNEQEIGLVIATAIPLLDLVRDIDLGSGQAFDGPFYPRQLGHFNKEETSELIKKALAGTWVQFDEDDYQYVWEISQGHPCKVQFACSEIFENKIFS